jgi:hypothetical protein
VIQATPRQQLSAFIDAPPQAGDVLVVNFLGLAEDRFAPPSSATGATSATARPIPARAAKSRPGSLTSGRPLTLRRALALCLFSFSWVLAHRDFPVAE